MTRVCTESLILHHLLFAVDEGNWHGVVCQHPLKMFQHRHNAVKHQRNSQMMQCDYIKVNGTILTDT